MLHPFTDGYKASRVAFYFSWLFPFQMTFFCTLASLKVPAMIVYDVATTIFDTEIFPQNGLISGITFIVLLSQEKPLR